MKMTLRNMSVLALTAILLHSCGSCGGEDNNETDMGMTQPD